jgi:hypothetical protein
VFERPEPGHGTMIWWDSHGFGGLHSRAKHGAFSRDCLLFHQSNLYDPRRRFLTLPLNK